MSFEGHPTLRSYLAWLEAEGFTYVDNRVPGAGVVFRGLITIFKDGEAILFVPYRDMGDPLRPSTVKRLDRRLDVESPFNKKPH